MNPNSNSINGNGLNKNVNTIEEFFKVVKKSKFITESRLTSRVLFCFIFMAILSKLIFSSIKTTDMDGSNGPATINVMCYFVILLSLIGIVFTSTILQMHENKKEIDILKTISWDFALVVIYLFWIMTINLKKYKSINMKKVPPTFFIYSNLSHFVIMFQIFFYMINFIINNDKSLFLNQDESISNRIRFVHYLLLVLNFLLILIQQIILDNFTVDVP